MMTKGDIIHYEFPNYIPQQYVLRGPHFAVVLYDASEKCINTVTIVPISSLVDTVTGNRRNLRSWNVEIDHNKYRLLHESYLKIEQKHTVDLNNIRLCDEKRPLDDEDKQALDLALIDFFEMTRTVHLWAKKKLQDVHDVFINNNEELLFSKLRSDIDSTVLEPLYKELTELLDALGLEERTKSELTKFFEKEKSKTTIRVFQSAKRFFKRTFLNCFSL